MAFNPSRYEHSYGVHLIDDIHNFFPEFLYDAGMFPGNQIVTFLQHRVHQLFPREYSHNNTNYRIFQLESRRREAVIPRHPMTQLRRTQHLRRPGHLQPQPTQPAVQAFTIPLTSIFAQSDNHNDANYTNDVNTITTLTTLLASALLGTRRNTEDTEDLLTPVVVAPTEEQISAASIVSTLEPAADITCAICQDHNDPSDNNEWRIIRHCSHRFHRGCIDEWFQQNVHCPVCRHDIRTTQ
jgi:hypothetical protein